MTRPTERQLLSHDLPMFGTLFSQRPEIMAALADTTDLARQSYQMVMADLFWQLWHHVIGAEALLRLEMETPLFVVERAVFEAAVGMGYLSSHPDRHRESIIFLAYSYLREQDEYSHQASLVANRASILARMPSEDVTTARTRLFSWPRNWSGKSIKIMAKEGNVQGYDTLYRMLSGTAHIGIVGRHVRVFDSGDGMRTIATGTELTQSNAESHANFLRRLFHGSFKLLMRELDAPAFTMNTWDPNDWDFTPPVANS